MIMLIFLLPFLRQGTRDGMYTSPPLSVDQIGFGVATQCYQH